MSLHECVSEEESVFILLIKITQSSEQTSHFSVWCSSEAPEAIYFHVLRRPFRICKHRSVKFHIKCLTFCGAVAHSCERYCVRRGLIRRRLLDFPNSCGCACAISNHIKDLQIFINERCQCFIDCCSLPPFLEHIPFTHHVYTLTDSTVVKYSVFVVPFPHSPAHSRTLPPTSSTHATAPPAPQLPVCARPPPCRAGV